MVAHLHRLGFVVNTGKSVLRPSQTARQSVSEKGKSHQIMRGSIQIRTEGDISSLPEAVGQDGFSCNRPTIRAVAHAAFSNVVSVFKAQSRQEQIPQSSGEFQMQEIPSNMKNPSVPQGGSFYRAQVDLFATRQNTHCLL